MTTIIDADLGRGSCALTRTLDADQLRRTSGPVVPEWLLTNGIGGYSSGTVCGELARRYHGLLVASLPAPIGRAVMLAAMSARVRLPDRSVLWIKGGVLAGETTAGEHLTRFTLDSGLPCWTYSLGAGELQEQLVLVHGQNTVLMRYSYRGPDRIRLTLRPFLSPRPHDAPVSADVVQPLEIALHGGGVELRFDTPLPGLQLRFGAPRGAFTADPVVSPCFVYATERQRGYDHEGSLWSPGYIRADLGDGDPAWVLATTDGWEAATTIAADDIEPMERRRRALLLSTTGCGNDPVQAELVLAADQFVIFPSWRTLDVRRARAEGIEPRSVVAGYHWFTDWGRDTMISLEGLTLSTGRASEARAILLHFAQHLNQGLIPNLFPEGDQTGLYHTADATLWMWHGVHRYARATGDLTLVEQLLPALQDSIEHHLAGTLFNIRVDPGDGLLSQGEEGYQLTWMDAKVDGWVVTPRRGKAVEINALWYNALRLTAAWTTTIGGETAGRRFRELGDRVGESFNRRFWYEAGGYLFDVVDGEQGDDPALRPNQVLAVALDHAVLQPDRWAPVMDIVREHLLTPVGLRSLAPADPQFKREYFGDLRSRDAAYHQGTVWGWLIGPYVDAWLKVHPGEHDEARRLLDGLVAHLGEAGLGTLSEIFDSMPPFTPRGCIAQAWSVAEVLRLWRALAATGHEVR